MLGRPPKVKHAGTNSFYAPHAGISNVTDLAEALLKPSFKKPKRVALYLDAFARVFSEEYILERLVQSLMADEAPVAISKVLHT